MSNEELVKQIQAGEHDLLPELWEGVRHFVWQQAYKCARVWAQNDSPSTVNDLTNDLYQEGYLAVVSASRRYKADKGALFLTYLGFYLKRHFKQTIAEYSGWNFSTFTREQAANNIARKVGKERRNPLKVDSLNRQILNEGSDDAIEQIDKIADPYDFVEDSTERMFLESLHNELEGLLNRLEPNENKAIRLRHYENMTYEGVGRTLNLPYSSARTLITNALHHLRSMAIRERCLEAYIDRNTSFYRHVGVNAFKNTGTSSVELIFLQREEMRAREARNGKV